MLQDKDKLRSTFTRAIDIVDLSNVKSTSKKLVDLGLKITLEHKRSSSLNKVDNVANLILQTNLLKSISILNLVSGLNHSNSLTGDSISTVYDPLSIGCLVRSQYESFCNFNNIYIQSSSNEELDLKYHLWVLAGLKNRQRFPATRPENIAKLHSEKVDIDFHINSVKSNLRYSQLDEKSKIRLDEFINKRVWKVGFISDDVIELQWYQLFEKSGVSKFEQYYNYLSALSHPTYISILQFGDSYSEEDIELRADLNSAKMLLYTSNAIVSFLIRDYIIHFELNQNLETLPIIDQLIVNSFNSMFRGKDYVMNDSLNKLN
jgi:hypothetical protein